MSELIYGLLITLMFLGGIVAIGFISAGLVFIYEEFIEKENYERE